MAGENNGKKFSILLKFSFILNISICLAFEMDDMANAINNGAGGDQNLAGGDQNGQNGAAANQNAAAVEPPIFVTLPQPGGPPPRRVCKLNLHHTLF